MLTFRITSLSSADWFLSFSCWKEVAETLCVFCHWTTLKPPALTGLTHTHVLAANSTQNLKVTDTQAPCASQHQLLLKNRAGRITFSY